MSGEVVRRLNRPHMVLPGLTVYRRLHYISGMATIPLIGHIDADCFYVSAERVRRRELRGLPVGVIGNQGACVIAKSYELKDAGVKTGTPIWDAVRLCPEAVFIPRDFRWYEELSRAMLACVRRCSPLVEYYSIDEFFFDARTLPQTFGGSLSESARALQQVIVEQIGVPTSIGISRSRTLAKLASDANKPFGCAVFIEESEIAAFIESIDIAEVTGIGHRSSQKLAARGIRTCGEFCRASRPMINKLLTKKGEAIWWELQGQPLLKIQPQRPMHKAVARGGSVGAATADPNMLHAWLVRNTERLIEVLCSHQYVAQRLGLCLSYKEHAETGAALPLPQATNAFELLLPISEELLRRCLIPGARVSHLDLIATELACQGRHQPSLFVTETPRLDRIKQLVNEKLGRWTVRSGATLPLQEIYADPAHFYDICDVQGKSCF